MVRGGRREVMDACHFLKVLLSASRSKERRGGRCCSWTSASGIHVVRIPAWSDPMDTSQSMMGGVMVVPISVAILWNVRLRVLLRSSSRPLRVIVPRVVCRASVWSAAHVSNLWALGDLRMFSSDQLRECKLKSPTSIVGKVLSMDRVNKDCKDEGSLTSL